MSGPEATGRPRKAASAGKRAGTSARKADGKAARGPGAAARAGSSKPAARKPVDRKPAARKRGRATPALLASPGEIYDRLLAAHPNAHCELDFQSPYQLAVATILSAQCTDRRVNMVTPALFAAYPDARALAAAAQEDVEELIRSTGFFRSKARNIIGMAAALVEHHGGEVPPDMEALVRLPGVGRKTANVILGNAFNIANGIAVDTHVQRVAGRLGLAHGTDPVAIEQELMREFEHERWTMLSHLLIFHGRRVCEARRPRCGECTLADICPSAPVFLARA